MMRVKLNETAPDAYINRAIDGIIDVSNNHGEFLLRHRHAVLVKRFSANEFWRKKKIKQLQPEIREVLEKIVSKRLCKHRDDLNRYLNEVKKSQKGRITKSKASQMAYSYQKTNEELAVCDELDYIIKEISKRG